MTQRLGQVTIKIDGALLESLPGAKIDLGGVVRTPVPGALGFSESLKESMIECEIAVGAGTSLAQLGAIKGATCTFECDTGQTFLVRDAFCTETLSATANEGKAALKLAGQPAEELMQ